MWLIDLLAAFVFGLVLALTAWWLDLVQDAIDRCAEDDLVGL
jgi:hypothetical protein